MLLGKYITGLLKVTGSLPVFTSSSMPAVAMQSCRAWHRQSRQLLTSSLWVLKVAPKDAKSSQNQTETFVYGDISLRNTVFSKNQSELLADP